MFFELINEAFFDSSYFYIFFVFLTFGIMYFNSLYTKHLVEGNYFFGDQHQTGKINLGYIDRPMIMNESIIIWLIMTCKRIDEKDDKEDNSSSYFKNVVKKRGGQLCQKTSCSQPLKNIAI